MRRDSPPGKPGAWRRCSPVTRTAVSPGELEYRVGSVDHPEPSWWSESAFAEYSESADVEAVRRWSDERLLAEVKRLEAQVQGHTQVER